LDNIILYFDVPVKDYARLLDKTCLWDPTYIDLVVRTTQMIGRRDGQPFPNERLHLARSEIVDFPLKWIIWISGPIDLQSCEQDTVIVKPNESLLFEIQSNPCWVRAIGISKPYFWILGTIRHIEDFSSIGRKTGIGEEFARLKTDDCPL